MYLPLRKNPGHSEPEAGSLLLFLRESAMAAQAALGVRLFKLGVPSYVPIFLERPLPTNAPAAMMK